MSGNPPWYGWPPGGDTSDVTSVFTRTGAVVATAGDYKASQVTNDSSVAGATVKDALQNAAGAGAVASVFTRTGAVVATAGDYAASQVTNDSAVSGARVSNALNTLAAAITALVTGVSSVYGRAGAVVATAGDYLASQVTNDSAVSGARVSNALNTLATAIAALVTGVSSVYGRTGAVVSAAGDYLASQVNNDSSVSGTHVSDALNTLLAAIGTTSPVWMVDVYPASPNARDSEGANTTGWSTWSPAGAGAVVLSAANSQLVLTATSQAADKFGGAYKTIPTGNEWVMYAKIAMRVGLQRFFQAGIFIGGDVAGAPTTAKFIVGAIVQGNTTDGNFKQATSWTNYTTQAGGSPLKNVPLIGFQTAGYVRMRVNIGANTFDIDHSQNGIDWVAYSGTTAFPFVPVYCGICVDNAATGNTLDGLFDFVRFVEGAGVSAFNGSALGALVNVRQ
jgi:hypothetical protein